MSDGGEEKQEEKPETVIVVCDGGIIVYGRLPDGTLDEGHEFSDTELKGDDVGLSDEDLRRAAERRTKSIDVDTILAVQDILEHD